MKNWKTSVFGVMTAIGLILSTSAQPGSSLDKIGKAVAAIGAIGNGASGKDLDVTGVGSNARHEDSSEK